MNRQKPGRNLGWYAIALATLFMYSLSLRPVANMLVAPLERRNHVFSEELLSTLDVMVILGGGIYPSDDLRGVPEASGITYSRVYSGVKLFNQSSAKTLVLSGGGLSRKNEREADVMKEIAINLGVSQEKIVTELSSRNTMGQAREIAKLFPPLQKKRIGIVTSAMHMLRSEQAFKNKFAEGYIVPIPVNYTHFPLSCTSLDFIPSVEAFHLSTYAIHEWVGRFYYFLCNRNQQMLVKI